MNIDRSERTTDHAREQDTAVAALFMMFKSMHLGHCEEAESACTRWDCVRSQKGFQVGVGQNVTDAAQS